LAAVPRDDHAGTRRGCIGGNPQSPANPVGFNQRVEEIESRAAVAAAVGEHTGDLASLGRVYRA
jgi:hypothetical protein